MVDSYKDAGCEESKYPFDQNKKKCWHFVKATRDYGFIEGAYNGARVTNIPLISLFALLFF